MEKSSEVKTWADIMDTPEKRRSYSKVTEGKR